MFAWFFLSALYLQLVLGYSPLQVGLAFLPANLIMGAFSLGLSAKLVMRFGIRLPLATGLLLAALGLLLFARAPVDGSFVVDVLPSMILLGIGAGMAFNPVLLAAMSDVEPSEAGLASGVVNTSFMMGGALGLAVLASLAASRTDTLFASGEDQLVGAQRGLPRGVPRRRALRRRGGRDRVRIPARARRGGGAGRGRVGADRAGCVTTDGRRRGRALGRPAACAVRCPGHRGQDETSPGSAGEDPRCLGARARRRRLPRPRPSWGA